MNVARLNFSHGTREQHAETMALIRSTAQKQRKTVAILQDLAGPKVRIGDFANGPVELASGQTFVLTGRDVPGDANEVSVNYNPLSQEVHTGDTLLLNDGALTLTVEKTDEKDVICRVVVGGPLSARKGINAPSRSLNVPFLTDKDKIDLEFALQHNPDYIALSFVRNANDVREARALLGDKNSAHLPALIAKFEKHEALSNMSTILEETDGIMVARGDLGVEIPLEQVPRVQKEIISRSNRAATPVITATQMLGSMAVNPRPTRAEASDVANAVLDGTDAVMLSEETAQGKYPAETVDIMHKLAVDAEKTFFDRQSDVTVIKQSAPEAVAESAARLAIQVGAKAIVTCTQSGSTARLVSRMKPSVPLIAVTPAETTYRKLALVWGAIPLLMEPAESAEAMERQALDSVTKADLLRRGDTVILTAGLPLHAAGTTNNVKVAVV